MQVQLGSPQHCSGGWSRPAYVAPETTTLDAPPARPMALKGLMGPWLNELYSRSAGLVGQCFSDKWRWPNLQQPQGLPWVAGPQGA